MVAVETNAENLLLETVVRLSEFVWEGPSTNAFDTLVLNYLRERGLLG